MALHVVFPGGGVVRGERKIRDYLFRIPERGEDHFCIK